MRLIDADALIDNKLERMIESFGIDFGRADVTFGLAEIDNAPTVEAEPIRHGHWTRVDYYPVGHDYICSICNRKHSSDFNFCPDCGAKMDEVIDNDDRV